MDNSIKIMPCQIRLLSPVLITSTVGDENIALSENYISGTALIGAIANYYINTRSPKLTAAHTDENFKKWFLEGELQFTNAYKLNDEQVRALPIPLSIQFPKSSEKPLELLFKGSDEETKYHDGFCILNQMESAFDFEKVAVNKHINFHHQRTNQLLGKSDSGEIFNYESLNPFQTFEACIAGPKKTLENFVEKLGDNQISCRLGRSKNTQYGQAEIEFMQSEMRDFEIPGYELSLENDTPEFTVTLLSHTILLNSLGKTQVGEEIFKTYLLSHFSNSKINVAKSDLLIENSFIRTEHIENYVAVWKARKPAAMAFRMGSCFRVRMPSDHWKANIKAIKALLLRMQQQGIGIRRNEGFGRIAINWQQDINIENKTDDKNKKRRDDLSKKMPSGSAPDNVKKIFVNALQSFLKDSVKSAAAIKLEEFMPLPTNALIGRLRRFLLKSQNEAEFLARVNNLKGKPAMDKLTGIRDQEKNQNFYEFLTNKLPGKDLTEIKNTISIKIKNLDESLVKVSEFKGDDQLMEEMYHEYLETLFALMQKKLKKEGNHE